MAFPGDGGFSGGVVLASSEGDLAFCQINLRLRSPDLPSHSFRCIYLPKRFWGPFVSGLYLLQKPIDPTSTVFDNEPSEVDYCVSFQFLTLPNGVYSAGFQFFLNFFLLTFVGMLYSMIILAMAQCLLPLVKKVFWAMTNVLSNYIGPRKEVWEKDQLVGSPAIDSAPGSGSRSEGGQRW